MATNRTLDRGFGVTVIIIVSPARTVSWSTPSDKGSPVFHLSVNFTTACWLTNLAAPMVMVPAVSSMEETETSAVA